MKHARGKSAAHETRGRDGGHGGKRQADDLTAPHGDIHERSRRSELNYHDRTKRKDIIMTLFVGNSACTDDQRADTLTYHLAILTQSVSLALVHLEALIQEPGSPDRDRRLGAILYALERVNRKAMQRGLGKGLEGISDEKHRLETLVARQQQERKAEGI